MVNFTSRKRPLLDLQPPLAVWYFIRLLINKVGLRSIHVRAAFAHKFAHVSMAFMLAQSGIGLEA
jgi:hypothetical protein